MAGFVGAKYIDCEWGAVFRLNKKPYAVKRQASCRTGGCVDLCATAAGMRMCSTCVTFEHPVQPHCCMVCRPQQAVLPVRQAGPLHHDVPLPVRAQGGWVWRHGLSCCWVHEASVGSVACVPTSRSASHWCTHVQDCPRPRLHSGGRHQQRHHAVLAAQAGARRQVRGLGCWSGRARHTSQCRGAPRLALRLTLH